MPDRYHDLRSAMEGRPTAYLYPLLGMEEPVRYDRLADVMPYDEATVRDDLRTLVEHDFFVQERDDAIVPVETEGFERLASALDGRSGDLVATEPQGYMLGERGEQYVAERELDELEDSLMYVFG